MYLHTEARRQQDADEGQLFESGKTDNRQHISAADPFQIDPPDIPFQVTARRIADSVKNHECDAGERQQDRDHGLVFFEIFYHIKYLSPHSDSIQLLIASRIRRKPAMISSSVPVRDEGSSKLW
jgi:hypothetical protein